MAGRTCECGKAGEGRLGEDGHKDGGAEEAVGKAILPRLARLEALDIPPHTQLVREEPLIQCTHEGLVAVHAVREEDGEPPPPPPPPPCEPRDEASEEQGKEGSTRGDGIDDGHWERARGERDIARFAIKREHATTCRAVAQAQADAFRVKGVGSHEHVCEARLCLVGID